MLTSSSTASEVVRAAIAKFDDPVERRIVEETLPCVIELRDKVSRMVDELDTEIGRIEDQIDDELSRHDIEDAFTVRAIEDARGTVSDLQDLLGGDYGD